MVKIGRFEIVGKLGRGAFGMVYKGHDPLINRLAAIKVMSEATVGDPELVARFKREAEAAGRLNHRNIVTIYDLGEHNGLPYIAMEFLEGRDLEKVIKGREEVAVDRKIDIVAQVADALQYVHTNGIIHRDIKPANIRLLEDGTVKIMDFGIAKMTSSDMTRTGQFMGTVNYMSPEQIKGKKIDRRADLFALGVVFYELISYRRPFPGDSITAVIYKIVNENPPPLDALHGTPYEWLESVIFRCLHKDAQMRWESAQELAEALRARTQVPASLSDARLDDTLSRVRRKIKQGEDLDDDMRQIDEILEQDPENRSALRAKRAIMAERVVRAADSLVASGRLEQARDQLMTAVDKVGEHQTIRARLSDVEGRLKATRAEQLVSQAQRYLEDRRYETAIKSLDQAVELDPYNQTGKQLLERAREERTRADVLQLLSEARADLENSGLEQARELALKALTLNPDNRDAHSLLRAIERERPPRRLSSEAAPQPGADSVGTSTSGEPAVGSLRRIQVFLTAAGCSATPDADNNHALKVTLDDPRLPFSGAYPLVLYASAEHGEDTILGDRTFLAKSNVLERLLPEDNATRMAFLVVARQPHVGVFHEMHRLRESRGLNVVLLPLPGIERAMSEGNELAHLVGELQRGVGGFNSFELGGPTRSLLDYFSDPAVVTGLLDRIRATNVPLLLHGVRASGKTSLLLRVLPELREEVVAYLDLEAEEDAPGDHNWTAIAHQLLEDAAVKAILLGRPGARVPAARELSTTGFPLVHEVISHLRSELSAKVVVILDGADRLRQPEHAKASRRLLQESRQLTRSPLDTRFVLASRRSDLAVRSHLGPEIPNPLRRAAEPLRMSALSADAVADLMTAVGGRMGFAFDGDAIRELARLSGGHPLIVRALGSEIVSGGRRQVAAELVSRSSQAALRRITPFGIELLADLTPRERILLLAAAREPVRNQDLARLFDEPRAGWYAMNALDAMGLLIGEPARVSYPLLAEWLCASQGEAGPPAAGGPAGGGLLGRLRRAFGRKRS